MLILSIDGKFGLDKCSYCYFCDILDMKTFYQEKWEPIIFQMRRRAFDYKGCINSFSLNNACYLY